MGTIFKFTNLLINFVFKNLLLVKIVQYTSTRKGNVYSRKTETSRIIKMYQVVPRVNLYKPVLQEKQKNLQQEISGISDLLLFSLVYKSPVTTQFGKREQMKLAVYLTTQAKEPVQIWIAVVQSYTSGTDMSSLIVFATEIASSSSAFLFLRTSMT